MRPFMRNKKESFPLLNGCKTTMTARGYGGNGGNILERRDAPVVSLTLIRNVGPGARADVRLRLKAARSYRHSDISTWVRSGDAGGVVRGVQP